MRISIEIGDVIALLILIGLLVKMYLDYKKQGRGILLKEDAIGRLQPYFPELEAAMRN